MSKKKKKKKNKNKHRSVRTKPDQINNIADEMFRNRYYCIGDELERNKLEETLRQNDRVV